MERDLVVTVVTEVVKHLPGKHNQQSHAGKMAAKKSGDRSLIKSAKELIVGMQKGLRGHGWTNRQDWLDTPLEERISTINDLGNSFGTGTRSIILEKQYGDVLDFFAKHVAGGDVSKLTREMGGGNLSQ